MGPGTIIILASLGAMLLWFGWRGRRRDDQWCRHCRLVLAEPIDLEGRCPRCHRELTSSNAMGQGRCTKRPVPIALGLVLLWAAASITATRAADRINAIDWQGYKPAFLLIDEAESSRPPVVQAAVQELLRRDQRGELSEQHRARLTDLVFDLCLMGNVDPALPWIHLLEQAWVESSLSGAQSLALARRLAGLQLRLNRGGAETEQFTSLDFHLWSSRDLALGTETLTIDVTPIRARLGDRTIDLDPTPGLIVVAPGSGSGSASSHTILNLESPGELNFSTTWKVVAQLHDHPETAVAWIEDVSIVLTNKPPGEFTPPILTDQESSDDMRAATSVATVGIRNFFTQPPTDVILGCSHSQSDEISIRSTREFQIGSRSLTSMYRPISAIFLLPFEPADAGKPLHVTLTANPPPRPRGRLPGLDPDMRPLWFGPPVTFTFETVRWFDSLDDPDLPEDIKKHHAFWTGRLAPWNTPGGEPPAPLREPVNR